MSASPIVVELRNVSLGFGDRTVLDDLSFAVTRGERYVLMGQTNAGKTCILRLIVGLEKPTAGSVIFEGRALGQMTDEELREMRHRIGFVYPEAALLSSLSVRGNLALPLQELTQKTPREIDRLVTEKLELVELHGTERLLPHELSGGMRKRVGIARALMMEPALLLFDEPTAGLDPVVSAVINKLIVDLSERARVTSIIATHQPRHALRVATRIAVLDHGRIIEDGAPEQFRQSQNPVVAEFLRLAYPAGVRAEPLSSLPARR